MTAVDLRRRVVGSYAFAGVTLLVLLLALFWRVWTPIDGAQRTFGWDAIWEYWGDLQFQFDAYADGTLPLWNPYDRLGYPFHADPQAGIFYPLTWLLLGGASLTGGVAYWWIAIKVILHFWLASMGMWAYLRRRGVHPAACYVGAVVLILGYPHIQNTFSALNWSIAWAPWLLLALDRWVANPTSGRVACVALASAMCVLAGAPAAVCYTSLVAVPYAFWAIASEAGRAEHSAPQAKAHRRALLRTGGLGAGLVLAMVAVQALSTARLLPHTVRDARSLAFITESTFGFDDIAAFLIPRMLGGNTYLGAGAVIWAAIALTAYCNRRRMVLAAIAIIGIALALGQNGAFLAAIASAFEPLGFFRRAHRFLYVAQIPIAILAAEGLHCVLSETDEHKRRRVGRAVLVWGVMAVTIFGIGFVVTQKPSLSHQPLRDAFVLACAASAVAVWITSMILSPSKRYIAAFAWVAFAFTFGDLWLARSGVIDRDMHPVPSTSRDSQVGALGIDPLQARIYDHEYLKYRPGIRLGLRDFGGYEDDPLSLGRYHQFLERVKQHPSRLGHANVGWYLDDSKRPLTLTAADKAAMERIAKGAYRLKTKAPPVAWYGRATIVDGGAFAALAKVLAAPAGSIAVLERETLPAHMAEMTALAGADDDAPTHVVEGQLVRLERNRAAVDVEAPREGVVVVSESYFPGWSATVDGTPAAIVPANGAFRGVAVGPGKHRIVFEYRPSGWLFLGVLSLVGFFTAISLVIYEWRRRGRRSAESSP